MTLNQDTMLAQLAQELGSSVHHVTTAVQLLDNGDSVPFIARYRKEKTGEMTDTQLRLLNERLPYLRELESRRQLIIQEIQTQGKLTPALNADLMKADTKQKLEDLYAPYKPKRRTRAQIAREAGLEPLAMSLLNDRSLDPTVIAGTYLNETILTTKLALDGARDILAEHFAEQPHAVGTLRELIWNQSHLYANKLDTATDVTIADKFRDYFDYHESLPKVASHRALAMLRGQAQGVLKLQCELPDYYLAVQQNQVTSVDPHPMELHLIKALDLKFAQRPADSFIRECVRWAWRVKLQSSLETDVLTRLKEDAHAQAIKVFSNNVRDVLLAAPATKQVVMGLDPGIRTGVKVALISTTGALLDTSTVYPFEPRLDVAGTLAELKRLVVKHQVELVAIGNGTGSRQTDALVAELLSTCKKEGLKAFKKVVVSEAGASVYSASELAATELPLLDVSLRGAVSIARRLQDPLAELVKIDPKAIGVGQYQHDLNAKQLTQALDRVVEDCVNAVGVDVNTASAPLLARVSGLSSSTAKAIVQHREQNGAFETRKDLLHVPRLGAKAFEQAAGFLRITGKQPLDASAVHPEAYPVVEKLLQRLNKPLLEVMGKTDVLHKVIPETLVDAQFGLPTVKDILIELEKPGRDPRGVFSYATFDDTVQTLGDLRIGMVLEGVVTNVAAFGAFVDIGVHQDGLVHISELGTRFVKDASTVVKAGQTVKVRVLDVDAPRKRIALTLRLQASVIGDSQPKVDSTHRAPRGDLSIGKYADKYSAKTSPPNTALSNAFAQALRKKV